jgi:hypothetical protein
VSWVRALMVAVVFAAGCGADDAGVSSQSSGTATTGAGAIELEDCDELLTQEACEAAVIDPLGYDDCAWLDVRAPGPTCSETAVVSRCVAFTYVGMGCQQFECPAVDTDVDGIDAFFRTMDGTVEVLVSPECGRIAVDGWTHCLQPDAPAECACLCG